MTPATARVELAIVETKSRGPPMVFAPIPSNRMGGEPPVEPRSYRNAAQAPATAPMHKSAGANR
jgi:hypothetical protein